MAAQRDENGRFLQGNKAASGRPPLPPELRAKCRRLTLEGLPLIEAILKDTTEPGATRIKAWEAFRDTGYGKPPQAIDLNVYTDLSIGELAAEAQRLSAEFAALEASGSSKGRDTVGFVSDS